MTKNSKQTKKSSQHRVPLFRRPWAVFLILIVLIGIVVAVLIWLRPQPQPNNEPTNSPNTSTNAPGGTSSDNQPSSKPQENPEDKPPQYEGEDPNTMEELTGSIARKSVSDGKLTVVATIDQYLSQPGICIIELKNPSGEVVYTASADAIPDVTTSICEPFIIATSQLSAGKYHIEIQLNGDNKQGTIIEEVEL